MYILRFFYILCAVHETGVYMPIILYENDVQKAIYILNVAEWSNFQAGHSDVVKQFVTTQLSHFF